MAESEKNCFLLMSSIVGPHQHQDLHYSHCLQYMVVCNESTRKSKKVTILIRVLHHMFYMLELNILFTNPFAQAGYDTRSILKWSLTGLNLEFSFSQTNCLTKAEETSLSYYLSIARGRIIGFLPFPRVLVLCEMQSISSRI